MPVQMKAEDTADEAKGAGEPFGLQGKQSINLKGMAERLGLSLGTVSRALNNHRSVSAATRQRVLKAARQYGYSPNSAARLLKAKSSMTVGLFFAPYYGPLRAVNPHALNLIEQLRAALRARGSELKVFYYQDDQSLRTQVLEANVGIFYGHFPATSLKVAHELKLPVLSFGKRSEFPGHLSVLVDAAHSCAQAMQYLAALGHERIGLMTGPTQEPYFSEYKGAYLDAIKEFNLPTEEGWVFELSMDRCNEQGAHDALLPLLKRSALKRPTAMVFASDWLAIGGRRAAIDAGLRLPEGFSIIGHDNLPVTQDLEPPLTTFDVHVDQVAQRLTELALTLVGQSEAAGRQMHEWFVSSVFIKRKSCACLRPLPMRGKR